ncbi:MAG: hypothetical protein SFZ23_06345 [Planctomycetota bacterium]|nr:hypothetical protein [Planctomycetota bacterium]
MMRTRYILEVSASRVALSEVRRGRVAQTAEVRLDRSAWPTDALAALASLQRPLEEVVDRLGVRGQRVSVVYELPGAGVAASSYASNVPVEQAKASACLTLASVGAEEAGLASDASVMARSSGSGRYHVLAIVDRRDRLEALATLISSVGLRARGFIPFEALRLFQAVQQSTGSDAAREGETLQTPPGLVLSIGENASSLAVAPGGELLLARDVPLGFESFVDAIERTIRGRDMGERTGDRVAEREAMRELLVRVGIPDPRQPIPGFEGLTGAAILPAIQPLLQRLSVEIKQSLRYASGSALSAGQGGAGAGANQLPPAPVATPLEPASSSSPRVRLRVSGQGASIPGLAAALSQLSGVGLDAEPASPQKEPGVEAASTSGAGGAISKMSSAAYLAKASRRAAFKLPKLSLASESRTRDLMRVRSAVLVGSGVAGLLLAWTALNLRVELANKQRALEQALVSASAEGSSARGFTTLAQVRAERSARSLLNTHVGSRAAAAGLMTAISRASPKGVTLITLQMSHDGDIIRAAAQGFIAADEAPDPARAIKTLLDALDASPLIATVHMDGTRRGSHEGREGQLFDFTMALVPTPHPAILSDANSSAASKVGSPSDGVVTVLESAP